MDVFIDPSYEYDAPMFVDFSEGAGEIDPEADKWFDGKMADDGDFLMEEEPDDQGSNEPNEAVNSITSKIPEEDAAEKSSSPQNEEIPEEPKAYAESSAEPLPIKQVPKNIVTSWSDWVAKTKTTVNQVTKEVKAENASQSHASQSQVRKKRAKKERERRSAGLRTFSSCSTASTASTISNSSDGGPAKKVPKIKAPLKLTFPETPTFMRRVQSKVDKPQAQKTREENELQVIAQKQKETMEKLRQNKVSMKKALAAQSYMPCRAVVDNVTFAKEFHFATDARLGPSAHHAISEDKGNDFVGSLRQHPPSPTFKNRKPTVPVPFKMTESRKKKEPDGDNNPCGGYQSMAQRVYQWQNKTPERYRMKPVSEQNQGPPNDTEKTSLKLTAPKTPTLKSRGRKRPLPPDCLSKEEQEKIQEAEIKSYKFKATELNRKIFDCNGTLGVYMEPKKPPTVIEPFNFNTEQRAEVHKTKEPTIIEEDQNREIKANPVPVFSNVFKPELPHKGTQIKPFSFEQRDKEVKHKKEEKIKAILEEEKKAHENFHAQPLPNFTPPPLPSSSKLTTEPAPFDLSTENRGAVKAAKWGQQLQQEIQEERMKKVFKARSTNVLYNAPFLPDKSKVKQGTKIEEFSMNSDKRAKDREMYEMHKAEREKEEEEAKRQLEKEREEEENIYIRALRKNLVHKPNPIRKYRAIEIKPSEKEPTDAQSPQWQAKKRRKLRD